MPIPRPFPALAALLVAACASTGRVTTAESAGDVAPAPAPPVVVRVRSDYPGPLTLYTVSEGVATRLGDLPGRRAEDFALGAGQLPSVAFSLLAVPRTGDARASTGVVRVAPGNVVDFTIGADLADARATVRSP
jgi:hypothetical protein